MSGGRGKEAQRIEQMYTKSRNRISPTQIRSMNGILIRSVSFRSVFFYYYYYYSRIVLPWVSKVCGHCLAQPRGLCSWNPFGIAKWQSTPVYGFTSLCGPCVTSRVMPCATAICSVSFAVCSSYSFSTLSLCLFSMEAHLLSNDRPL